MKRLSVTLLLAGWLLAVALGKPAPAVGEDSDVKARIPEGVYLEMTRNFYEALREEGARGTKTYTNDPANQYLRQIAVSTRFMVETNLQILKQQEKILQVLHSILEKEGRGR